MARAAEIHGAACAGALHGAAGAAAFYGTAGAAAGRPRVCWVCWDGYGAGVTG